MAGVTLLPGSIVRQPGVYLVSHSTGHLPDAYAHLREGMLLPSCNCDGCQVSFTFVGDDWLWPQDHA